MQHNIERQNSNNRSGTGGFTLVELLVVVGIIVILVGILVPVVGRVRTAARVAAVRNEIKGIEAAIERYRSTFGSYPGPLSNDQIFRYDNAPPAGTTIFSPAFSDFDVNTSGGGFDTTETSDNDPKTRITMAENLVLGLLGGLRVETGTLKLIYDPALVGQGPQSLNPRSPKRYTPFLETANLSWRIGANGKTGDFADEIDDCYDSLIPEFVDSFPNPLPILYLRARPGGTGIVSNMNNPPNYQYDLVQIIAYTGAAKNGRYIGVGKDVEEEEYNPPNSGPRHGLNRSTTPVIDLNDQLDKKNSDYPFTIFPYLKHPTIAPTNPAANQANATGTPRQKDGYILISAGADRVYGTSDDITSFGSLE